MATVTKWSGVQIAIQSALASAKTISAITKASPGVVTSTAHGYSNGDYVLLTVQGMSQVDGRVFRVASAATDTFALESEDTTNYDTFSSGTAQKITFGTTLNTVLTLSGSGGDFGFIDTTTIHQTVKTQVPGPANPLSYTMQNLWDPGDAGLVALKTAGDNTAARAIRITFANSYKVLFNGYVACSMAPGGNAQDKVETSAVITAFGRPTTYTT